MNNYNDARARGMSGHSVNHNNPQDEQRAKQDTAEKRSAAQPKGPGSHNISEEARKRMAEGGRKGGTISRRGPSKRSGSSAS